MNYKVNLEKELKSIESINKKPTLLLHSCCAPCSSYVLEYLTQYFEIIVYYYNPNITPSDEYLKRVNDQKRLIEEMTFKEDVKFIEGEYDYKNFFKMSKGLEKEKEGGKRCYKCYEMRIHNAVNLADKNKIDYVTTTLSISPYKNVNWINEIGERLCEYKDVKWLYADFKKDNGYKRSIELSKVYNLYRQDYCGCVYSKKKD